MTGTTGPKINMNQELVAPIGIDGDIDGTRWIWHVKKIGSNIPTRSGRRYEYPEWIDHESLYINEGKGLYIWTIRNGHYCRFVHVGISERGTVADRTKTHIRGQLKFTDRVHHMTWNDRFGNLGEDLRLDEKRRDAAARDFLRRLEIIFLFPNDDRARSGIRTMEGIISYTAAFLLDQTPARVDDSRWETTNTLSKHRQWTATQEKAEKVAVMLNNCIEGGILPLQKRI